MNLITLETPRLILKGFSPEDMKFIFTNFSKSKIMELLGHRSEDDYLKEVNKHHKGYSSYNRSFKLFLLTDKASANIIGRCGLHNWNTEHQRAEIGYVMEDENFKRKSLMSESVKIIIDYGFQELHLNRLEALVGVGNVPSIRILEKNHFKKEGVLRQHLCISGKFEDSFCYSLLLEEYHSNIGKK